MKLFVCLLAGLYVSAFPQGAPTNNNAALESPAVPTGSPQPTPELTTGQIAPQLPGNASLPSADPSSLGNGTQSVSPNLNETAAALPDELSRFSAGNSTTNVRAERCDKVPKGTVCSSDGAGAVGDKDALLQECEAKAKECEQKSQNKGDCQNKLETCKKKITELNDMSPKGPSDTFGF